jgi:hypothetical protein
VIQLSLLPAFAFLCQLPALYLPLVESSHLCSSISGSIDLVYLWHLISTEVTVHYRRDATFTPLDEKPESPVIVAAHARELTRTNSPRDRSRADPSSTTYVHLKISERAPMVSFCQLLLFLRVPRPP